MRYAYKDLGTQREGATAVVRWGVASATVMLFDPVNFTKYVDRLPSHSDGGGRFRTPPARLTIPADGRWYVVADLGGHSSGRGPTIEVEVEAGPSAERQETQPTHAASVS